MCGEKHLSATMYPCCKGSPPRVRGEGTPYYANTPCTGITPACAGRRPAACRKSGCGRDHPRVCGEKAHVVVALDHDIGSPPRVRGEARRCNRLYPGHWITPACAGRRITCSTWCFFTQDHPRVCGEKSKTPLTACGAKGSPPRVRGEAGLLHERFCDVRITPACAGRSAAPHGRSRFPEDHPRVCGEKQIKVINHRIADGSPPRVRGEGRANRLLLVKGWITPACAGRRQALKAQTGYRSDHPRVCGEKAM